MHKFSLESIWNKAIEHDNPRPLLKRDYLYASELGSGYIDRFLSMAAVPPSNPPNARSQRKFKAGHIWEWIVWYVLERSGMVKEFQGGTGKDQKSIRHQLPGLLKVSGRLDILVGGTPNIQAGLKAMSDMFLPDFLDKITELMMQLGEVRNTIVEVKSCSSQMFDRYEATRRPANNHVGQLQHYIHAKNLPGCIVYICKDDCRLIHFHIEVGDPLAEEIYRNDVQWFSEYYYRNESPPIENPILYNEEQDKWELNWRIEYSKYLTLVYGYEEPINFREEWEGKRDRWNRVIKRYKEGKPQTADNIAAGKEMDQYRAEYLNVKRFFNTVNI